MIGPCSGAEVSGLGAHACWFISRVSKLACLNSGGFNIYNIASGRAFQYECKFYFSWEIGNSWINDHRWNLIRVIKHC